MFDWVLSTPLYTTSSEEIVHKTYIEARKDVHKISLRLHERCLLVQLGLSVHVNGTRTTNYLPTINSLQF